MGYKNLFYQTPSCFGRHVKPLIPAAFAVVSTHLIALGPRGVTARSPNEFLSTIKAIAPALGISIFLYMPLKTLLFYDFTTMVIYIVK
jgi:hypothetical protein